MIFDIYSDELAEPLYWFMEERYDSYCEYLSEQPGDVSLAEYVDMFYLDEFKVYCETVYGYNFES